MDSAVLITYMGAPSNLKEIKPFLYRLFSDREIINFGVPSFLQKPLAYLIATFRTPKVRPQYEAIGGGSPLVKYAREQAELLKEKLKKKVFLGMLYSEPLLEEVAKEVVRSGVKELSHITLYPQFSYATTGACIKEVERLLGGKVKLKHVKSWCTNPYYIEWIREGIRKFLKKELKKPVILFSAHSLPEYFVKERNDPYPQEVERSVKLVMESFKGIPYKISYQSKVGPIKWLEPSTESQLMKIKEEGFKEVIVFPISFISEHIETLYELDVEYAEVARELGLEFLRVKLDHSSPLLIEALRSSLTD